ncbi:ROK family protein [Catellatospora sp. NPDC049133]|uniref:ROK family protein n=1 Tax=Catellatospora sp. NPDC049133 TaxID=3155499 RepID=UPI0033C5CC2F
MSLIMTIRVETETLEGALFDVDLTKSGKGRIRPEIYESNQPVARGNSRAYNARLIQFINDFQNRMGVSGDLIAIALIHPGIVDSKQGVAVNSRFEIWNEPVANTITEAFSTQAFVFHDAPCLALGEVRYGANGSASVNTPDGRPKTPKNFVYVIVDEGVGGCIFIEGRPYAGASLNAGDLGHILLDDHGPLCRACDRPGCLETYTGRYWIAEDILARYRRLRETKSASIQDSPFSRRLSFLEPDNVTVEDIASGTREGNDYVVPAIEQAADRLGMGLAYALDYLNPEVVILGGALMTKVDLYYELAMRATQRRCLPIAWESTAFRRAGLDHAEHYGAMDLALTRIRAELGRSHRQSTA